MDGFHRNTFSTSTVGRASPQYREGSSSPSMAMSSVSAPPLNARGFPSVITTKLARFSTPTLRSPRGPRNRPQCSQALMTMAGQSCPSPPELLMLSGRSSHLPSRIGSPLLGHGEAALADKANGHPEPEERASRRSPLHHSLVLPLPLDNNSFASRTHPAKQRYRLELPRTAMTTLAEEISGFSTGELECTASGFLSDNAYGFVSEVLSNLAAHMQQQMDISQGDGTAQNCSSPLSTMQAQPSCRSGSSTADSDANADGRFSVAEAVKRSPSWEVVRDCLIRVGSHEGARKSSPNAEGSDDSNCAMDAIALSRSTSTVAPGCESVMKQVIPTATPPVVQVGSPLAMVPDMSLIPLLQLHHDGDGQGGPHSNTGPHGAASAPWAFMSIRSSSAMDGLDDTIRTTPAGIMTDSSFAFSPLRKLCHSENFDREVNRSCKNASRRHPVDLIPAPPPLKPSPPPHMGSGPAAVEPNRISGDHTPVPPCMASPRFPGSPRPSHARLPLTRRPLSMRDLSIILQRDEALHFYLRSLAKRTAGIARKLRVMKPSAVLRYLLTAALSTTTSCSSLRDLMPVTAAPPVRPPGVAADSILNVDEGGGPVSENGAEANPTWILKTEVVLAPPTQEEAKAARIRREAFAAVGEDLVKLFHDTKDITLRCFLAFANSMPLSLNSRLPSDYLLPTAAIVAECVSCGVHNRRSKNFFVSISERVALLRGHESFTTPESLLIGISQISNLVSQMMSSFALGAVLGCTSRWRALHAQDTTSSDDVIEIMQQYAVDYCTAYDILCNEAFPALRQQYPNLFILSSFAIAEADGGRPPILTLTVSTLMKLVYLFAGGAGSIRADDRRMIREALYEALRSRVSRQTSHSTPNVSRADSEIHGLAPPATLAAAARSSAAAESASTKCHQRVASGQLESAVTPRSSHYEAPSCASRALPRDSSVSGLSPPRLAQMRSIQSFSVATDAAGGASGVRDSGFALMCDGGKGGAETCKTTDDVALSIALQVPAASRIVEIGNLILSGPLARHMSTEESVRAARAVSCVWRVLFQTAGLLPRGSSCPPCITQWIAIFPLYALNTDAKRVMLSVYAKSMDQTPLVVGPVARQNVLESTADILHDLVAAEEARRTLQGTEKRTPGGAASPESRTISPTDPMASAAASSKSGESRAASIAQAMEENSAPDGRVTALPVSYHICPVFNSTRFPGPRASEEKRPSSGATVHAIILKDAVSSSKTIPCMDLYDLCARECASSVLPGVDITRHVMAFALPGGVAMLRLEKVAELSMETRQALMRYGDRLALIVTYKRLPFALQRNNSSAAADSAPQDTKMEKKRTSCLMTERSRALPDPLRVGDELTIRWGKPQRGRAVPLQSRANTNPSGASEENDLGAFVRDPRTSGANETRGILLSREERSTTDAPPIFSARELVTPSEEPSQRWTRRVSPGCTSEENLKIAAPHTSRLECSPPNSSPPPTTSPFSRGRRRIKENAKEPRRFSPSVSLVERLGRFVQISPWKSEREKQRVEENVSETTQEARPQETGTSATASAEPSARSPLGLSIPSLQRHQVCLVLHTVNPYQYVVVLDTPNCIAAIPAPTTNITTTTLAASPETLPPQHSSTAAASDAQKVASVTPPWWTTLPIVNGILLHRQHRAPFTRTPAPNCVWINSEFTSTDSTRSPSDAPVEVVSHATDGVPPDAGRAMRVPMLLGWLLGQSLGNDVTFTLPLPPLAFRILGLAVQLKQPIASIQLTPADLSLLLPHATNEQSWCQMLVDLCAPLSDQEFSQEKLGIEVLSPDFKGSFPSLGGTLEVGSFGSFGSGRRHQSLRKSVADNALRIMWGGNGDAFDVGRKFWEAVLRGARHTPLLESSLFMQCCSRTVREVLCGPYDHPSEPFTFRKSFVLLVEYGDSVEGGARGDRTAAQSSGYKEFVCQSVRRVLDELPLRERRALLRFLTGNSVLTRRAQLDSLHLAVQRGFSRLPRARCTNMHSKRSSEPSFGSVNGFPMRFERSLSTSDQHGDADSDRCVGEIAEVVMRACVDSTLQLLPTTIPREKTLVIPNYFEALLMGTFRKTRLNAELPVISRQDGPTAMAPWRLTAPERGSLLTVSSAASAPIYTERTPHHQEAALSLFSEEELQQAWDDLSATQKETLRLGYRDVLRHRLRAAIYVYLLSRSETEEEAWLLGPSMGFATHGGLAGDSAAHVDSAALEQNGDCGTVIGGAFVRCADGTVTFVEREVVDDHSHHNTVSFVCDADGFVGGDGVDEDGDESIGELDELLANSITANLGHSHDFVAFADPEKDDLASGSHGQDSHHRRVSIHSEGQFGSGVGGDGAISDGSLCGYHTAASFTFSNDDDDEMAHEALRCIDDGEDDADNDLMHAYAATRCTTLAVSSVVSPRSFGSRRSNPRHTDEVVSLPSLFPSTGSPEHKPVVEAGAMQKVASLSLTPSEVCVLPMAQVPPRDLSKVVVAKGLRQRRLQSSTLHSRSCSQVGLRKSATCSPEEATVASNSTKVRNSASPTDTEGRVAGLATRQVSGDDYDILVHNKLQNEIDNYIHDLFPGDTETCLP